MALKWSLDVIGTYQTHLSVVSFTIFHQFSAGTLVDEIAWDSRNFSQLGPPLRHITSARFLSRHAVQSLRVSHASKVRTRHSILKSVQMCSGRNG